MMHNLFANTMSIIEIARLAGFYIPRTYLAKSCCVLGESSLLTVSAAKQLHVSKRLLYQFVWHANLGLDSRKQRKQDSVWSGNSSSVRHQVTDQRTSVKISQKKSLHYCSGVLPSPLTLGLYEPGGDFGPPELCGFARF